MTSFLNNVDLAEKVRQQQKKKTQTGMSIQATVNQALIKRLPQGAAGGMIEQPSMNNGWGATK